MRCHLPSPRGADALERIADPVAFVHRGGMDRALLATARVGVGNIGIDLRILRQLLFTQDDPVLHIDVEGTVTEAVDAVGGRADLVPGELPAIEVLPVAVGVFLGQRVLERFKPVQGPGLVRRQNPGTGKRRITQEIPTLHAQHVFLLPITRPARPDRRAGLPGTR